LLALKDIADYAFSERMKKAHMPSDQQSLSMLSLFEEFTTERRYLHNVSPKTLDWCKCSRKAFRSFRGSKTPSIFRASPSGRGTARRGTFRVRVHSRGASSVFTFSADASISARIVLRLFIVFLLFFR
jgi:hypothetical protein